MKKLLSVLLALAMLLTLSVPAFAGQEETQNSGIVLSSNIDIDREKAGEIMDALGLEDNMQDAADSVLAVIDALSDELTITKEGIGYRLFLNDTELVSVAGGMSSKGFTLLSSLFPDHALFVSKFTIHLVMAVQALSSDFLGFLRREKKSDVQEDVQIVGPYIEELLEKVSRYVRIEEPQKGSFDCGDAGTYNTMVAVDIDTGAIVDVLNELFAKMSRDEKLLKILEKMRVTAEALSHLSIVSNQLPSVDMAFYMNTDDNGGQVGSDRYFTASFFLQKKNDAAASVDVQVHEDSFSLALNIPGSGENDGISASVRFVPFDMEAKAGGGAFDVNIRGRYFGNTFTITPGEDGSALVIADDIYVLDSEKPLAEAFTVIETGSEVQLDLSTGDRTVVSLESLIRKRSFKEIDHLVKSVMENAQSMAATAADAVPELGDLLGKRIAEETEAE